MTVGIVGAGRGDRDRGIGGGHERLGRRRLAPVMRHLEQVDPRDAAGQHDRVDVLFHVAGQEEPAPADFAEQDDRNVVDARAGVGRLGGDRAAVRPQHAHPDGIDRQSIAGRQAEPHRRARSAEPVDPRSVTGTRSAHPGFEHARDAIAVEQQRETRDMVLVRVREDDRVDPAVPRRDVPVQDDEQAVGVWATVDQQAPAVCALDQDGVPLPDIEDGDPHVLPGRTAMTAPVTTRDVISARVAARVRRDAAELAVRRCPEPETTVAGRAGVGAGGGAGVAGAPRWTRDRSARAFAG